MPSNGSCQGRGLRGGAGSGDELVGAERLVDALPQPGDPCGGYQAPHEHVAVPHEPVPEDGGRQRRGRHLERAIRDRRVGVDTEMRPGRRRQRVIQLRERGAPQAHQPLLRRDVTSEAGRERQGVDGLDETGIAFGIGERHRPVRVEAVGQEAILHRGRGRRRVGSGRRSLSALARCDRDDGCHVL